MQLKNVCRSLATSFINSASSIKMQIKKLTIYPSFFHSSLPARSLATKKIRQIQENLEIPNKIHKINSVREISTLHPKGTLVFFDIDDTLLDLPYMLGSRAWRRYISEATKGSDRNWHDIFSLFINKNIPVVTVEKETSQLVKDLQQNGCEVYGLTARERQMWYQTSCEGIDRMTIKQLKSLNILFQRQMPSFMQDTEFFKGVYFADTDAKGDYLRKIVEKGERPKFIFIDDKRSQCESVSSALKELGINHECYWYCAADAKAEGFKPLIANIQLYYLWLSQGKEILSDQEAESISLKYPDKDADYYLKALLKNAGSDR